MGNGKLTIGLRGELGGRAGADGDGNYINLSPERRFWRGEILRNLEIERKSQLILG